MSDKLLGQIVYLTVSHELIPRTLGIELKWWYVTHDRKRYHYVPSV